MQVQLVLMPGPFQDVQLLIKISQGLADVGGGWVPYSKQSLPGASGQADAVHTGVQLSL